MTENQKLYVWYLPLPDNRIAFCIAQGVSQDEAISRLLDRVATTITSDPDRLDKVELGLRLQPHSVELLDGVAVLGIQVTRE